MLANMQMTGTSRSPAFGSLMRSAVTAIKPMYIKPAPIAAPADRRNPFLSYVARAAATNETSDGDAPTGTLVKLFKRGDDLTQMWTFGAELRHLRRAAETYQAHPEGVPPLVLAEHIAFVITKDMTGLLRLGVTSHAPTVLLHEILLARGIQSKLVKGYTVMRGIKKGATTSCCPNIWVEACGQEFDMLARVADDLGQFFNSKLPAGAPPGGMSTLRVKERPLDVPLATELDPNPALKEESRELEHLWIAMERAQGEEHRILTYWFYSGAPRAVLAYRGVMLDRFGNHDNWVRLAKTLRSWGGPSE